MVNNRPSAQTDTKIAGDLTPTFSEMQSWMTRDQAARFLGVTTQSIRNYEKRGWLKAEHIMLRDAHGREQDTAVLDPRAVAAVKRMKSKDPSVHVITEEESTRDWFTRAKTMEWLRVSSQTLKNYERDGKIHPKKARRPDARGHDQIVVVYDPNEIKKLPRGLERMAERSPGEIEARCFELFEEGKSVREIVILVRETRDVVRGLYESWLDEGGSKVVISSEAKRLLEAKLGPFDSVTDLVDLVTARG